MIKFCKFVDSKSVYLERLAEVSGLLNNVNGLDLLLQEKREEVGLVRCPTVELLKRRFVGLTGHEGRAQTVHEDFRELTVPVLHDLPHGGVILLKVGCHQIQLLVSLPEALDLESGVHQRVVCHRVSDLLPEPCFEGCIWKTVVKHFLDIKAGVRFVVFECFGAHCFLFIQAEVR